MRAFYLGASATAIAALAACSNRASVQCETDPNCNLTTGGVCARAQTGNHWCAYPDPNCPGGYRYTDQDVGDGVSGECVAQGPTDAGIDTPVDGTSGDDGDTACRLRVAFVDGAGTARVAILTEVWASNIDGSGMVNLSNSPSSNDTSPSWEPGGLRVAFASDRTGHYDVFTVNVDGTGLTNLTAGPDLPYDATQPAWSPDGSHIAFLYNQSIWLMKTNGTEAIQISTRRVMNSFSWSPDGTHIVFDSPSGGTFGSPTLYVVKVGDGSPAVKLTTGSGLELGATWNPHSRILFSNDQDIFSIAGDGSAFANVTQSSEDNNSSPISGISGTPIVYSSERGGHVELWSIAAVGAAFTPLTHNTIDSGGDLASDVSADGKLVAFSRRTTTVNNSQETNVNQVGVVHIDGTNLSLFSAPGSSRATSPTFSTCR